MRMRGHFEARRINSFERNKTFISLLDPDKAPVVVLIVWTVER